MLATLLPGLRHVRTPLVAGASWMLVIWLWFGQSRLLRDDESSSTAESRLRDISELVGPGVTLAAVSFVALLLGGLMPTPRFLLPTINNLVSRASDVRYTPERTLYPFVADLAQSVYGRVRWIDLTRGVGVPTFVRRWANDVVEHLVLRDDDDLKSLHNRAYPSTEPSFDPIPFDDLRRVINDGIEGETDQMTVQLQLERETIYNEVDRLRAEADLRLALFFPCVALSVVAAALSSWWVLLGVVAPVLLLAQAAISENAARTRIATAIVHGTVTPAVASYFREFAALEQWPPLGPGNPEVNETDHAATSSAWDELLIAVAAMQSFSPASGHEDARPLWTALRTRATLLVDRLDSEGFSNWLAAELQRGSLLMLEASERGETAASTKRPQAAEIVEMDRAVHTWVAALTKNLRHFRSVGLDNDVLIRLAEDARSNAAEIAERNGWPPPATDIPGLVPLEDE